MDSLLNLCFNFLICEIRKLKGVMVGINKLMNIKSVVSKFLAHRVLKMVTIFLIVQVIKNYLLFHF